MRTFERLESRVRSYCRSFPVVFTRARGHVLEDAEGRRWIDFFAGAGALNYGHNDPHLREPLLDYLAGDGIVHSLDMHTGAKAAFLEALDGIVLAPRGLEYRVMFPGPTGTNAVEAALKIARKATGRRTVVAFTGAFHGMTLGSLALTANPGKRGGAGVDLPGVIRVPFEGRLGPDGNEVEVLERVLEDAAGGPDAPAAVILETVQAEGGVNVASAPWLRRVARAARSAGALLVIDDIQVGCGRTGSFFSFEEADLRPDLVCLSKALSGYGLPLSVVLVRPDHDVLAPGEHNGTFRGHNPAFVTATAALERFWRSDGLARDVRRRGARVAEVLGAVARRHGLRHRGRGMIAGLVTASGDAARRISRRAFEDGLVVETSGPRDEVVKVLPPLTIPDDALDRGLEILAAAVADVTGTGDGEPVDADLQEVNS